MTDTNLNPTTSPDAQEALARRWGNDVIIILPLASGNLGVFGRDFQLHIILHDAPSSEELRRLSRELHAKMKQDIHDTQRNIQHEVRTPTPRPAVQPMKL